MTDAKTGLYAALAAFQKDLPSVPKTETAKIDGREGRQGYKYDYAPLEAVAEKVLPLLGKHGLAFVSKPTLSDGRFVLAYSLLHSAGEREDGEYPLPANGTPQDLGKAISYARRYCLCAVTGVAPGGEDNDAQGVPAHATEKPRQAERRPQERPQRQEQPAPASDEGWGDWPVVIDAIASQEDAQAARDEIDKAVADGRMDDVKAAKIKRAMTIKGNTAARQGGAG